MSTRKLKKTGSFALLAASSVTLLATVGACGRTAGSDSQKLLELASATSKTGKLSANSVGSLAKTSTADMERLLRALIDKEREERIAEDKRLSGRIDGLEADLATFKDKVEKQFDAVDKRDTALRLELDGKFADLAKVDADLAKSLQGLRTDMESRASSLESKLDLTKSSLEAQMNQKISAVSSRIDTLSASVDERVAKLQASDSALAEEIKNTQTQVKTNAADANDKLAALSKKLDDKEAALQKSINDARLDANLKSDELNKKLEDYRTSLTNLIEAKAAEFSLSLAKQDASLKATLEAQKKESAARFEKVEKDLADQKSALESKISSSVSSLKNEMTKLISSTDSATKSLLQKKIDDLASKSGADLISAREELISAMGKQSADAQIKMAALAVSVENVKTEGAKQRQELEDRLSKKISAVENWAKSEVAAVRSELSSKINDLSNEVQAVQTNLSNSIKTGLSELSGRQDAALQGYKLEQIAELSKLKNQQGDTAARLAALGSDFSSYQVAQKDVIDGMKSKMDSSLSKLEEKLSAETKAQVQTLRAEMNKTNSDFVLQMSQMKGDFAQKNIELTQQMNANYSSLTSSIQNLDDATKAQVKTLTDRAAAQEAKMHEVRAQLALQISSLNADLASTRVQYDAQIAGAKAEARIQQELAQKQQADELAKLQAQLQQVTQSQNDARAKLEADLKSALSSQDASAQDAINSLKGQLTEMDKKTLVTFSDLKTSLAAERVKTEASIAASMKAVEQKCVAETQAVAARVEAVAQAQEDFKAFVAANYATKGELESVRLRVQGLEDVTKIMNAKIDENDANVKKLISAEVSAAKKTLVARIVKVEASVDSVKSDLGGAIKDFGAQLSKIKDNMSSEIANVRMDMKTQDNALFAKLAESDAAQKSMNADLMQKVKSQAADFELMSQSVKKELNDRILALDSLVDETNVELKKARDEAKEQYNQVVIQQQAMKDQMASELVKLKSVLQDVAKTANQALAIGTQAASDVKLLKADFETQKKAVADQFKLQGDQISKLDTAMKDMKDDFNKRLSDVSNKAAQLVANLGAEVQENFQKTATDIAKIRANQQALESKMNGFIQEVQADDAAQAAFEKDIKVPQKALTVDLVNALRAYGDMRTAFLRALQPNQTTGEWYDKSFQPIMAECGGNANATFANALGRDSFDYLADEYAYQLVFGTRGSAADSVFFGNVAGTDGKSLHHFIMIAALKEVEGGGDNAGCMSKIRSWASSILYGTSNDAKNLRNKIVADDKFKRSVATFVQQMAGLKTNAANVEGVVSNAVKKLKNAEAILQVGREDGSLPLLARYAQTIVDGADNAFDAIERESEFNKMIDVQNKFAAENADLKKNIEKVKTDLTAQLDTFKQKTSQDISALQNEDAKIKASLGKALDVLMSLAIRGGQQDLALAALDAGKSIGYTPQAINQVKPAVSEIQHFFDNPALASSSDTCTGSTIKRGAGVKFWTAGGQCWVNFRGIPWGSWMSTANTIWFRMFGAAEKVRIRASLCDRGENSDCDRTYSFGQANLLAANTKLTGAPHEGVFDFRAPNILEPYMRRSLSWYGEDISFTAMRNDGSAAVSSTYTVQLYSPLVLDFMPIGRPEFIAQERSNVKFDLMGTGKPQRTGWLKGHAPVALLALPNAEGKVTSGRELFGEATIIKATGKKARDGYAALAQYDLNRDGVIDVKDSVYSKLVVWFDKNQNGVADAGELVSLKDAQVTAISVKMKPMPEKERFVEGNDLRTTAKFWGPSQCGSTGCNSYDVYFGTSYTLSRK
ncbi:hypothetical protein EBU99_01355 [bacterium]|nr:hypothetical protein [bacterium]